MNLGLLDFMGIYRFYDRYLSRRTNFDKILKQGDYFITEVDVDSKKIKTDSEALTDTGKGMEMIYPLVLISGALGNDFPGNGTIYSKQNGKFYKNEMAGKIAIELVVKEVTEKQRIDVIKLETNVYDCNTIPYGLPLPIFKGEAIVLVPKALRNQQQYKQI